MPASIWIDGKHEWVENAEAFALIIDEKLGRDAADLFRSYLKTCNPDSISSYIEEALDILRLVEGATGNDDYNLAEAIEILEELTL